MYYRVIKKRPIVTVFVDDSEEVITGEVLRVSRRKGIMVLAALDNPGEMTLVYISKVKAIRFENQGFSTEKQKLDDGTKQVLNLVGTGYGNEIEKRWKCSS